MKLIQFADHCTALMTENHLTTDAIYPVKYGTAITVKCDPQYVLMGSQVITCEKGIVYSHQYSRPKCVNQGKQTSSLPSHPG